MSKHDPQLDRALEAVSMCGFDIRGVPLFHAPSGVRYMAQGVSIREHDLMPCVLYHREGDSAGITWSRPVDEFFPKQVHSNQFDVRWIWPRSAEAAMRRLQDKALIAVLLKSCQEVKP